MAAPDSNPIVRIVQRVLRRLRFDFVRVITGKVFKQDPDGSLRVQPDDPAYPQTLPVPPRYGVPGITCKVAPGAQCLVSYENSGRGRPVVTSWGDATLQELVIARGSQGAARVGDTVDCGYLTVVTGPLGLGAASVVQSVVWAPPGTTPAPVSVPPLTVVYPLQGRITTGSQIVKVG